MMGIEIFLGIAKEFELGGYICVRCIVSGGEAPRLVAMLENLEAFCKREWVIKFDLEGFESVTCGGSLGGDPSQSRHAHSIPLQRKKVARRLVAGVS